MSVSGHTSDHIPVHTLTSKTPILGQKLYVVIAVTVAALTTVLLLIIILLIYKHRSKRRRVMHVNRSSALSTETVNAVTKSSDQNEKAVKTLMSMFELDSDDGEESKPIIKVVEKNLHNDTSFGSNNSCSGLGTGSGSGTGTSGSEGASSSSARAENVNNIGWGRWFSLSELETATNRFSEENVIGEGGYGVVYRGVLHDGLSVAVKNLLDNRAMYGDVVSDVACDDHGDSVAEREGRLRPSSVAENQRCAAIGGFMMSFGGFCVSGENYKGHLHIIRLVVFV